MTVRTIDHVLEELDGVVAHYRSRGHRGGYFAALYRRVTREVAAWIAADRFDDGARMERLDVLFADRYLDAVRARDAGRPTSRAWRVAFDSAEDWWPIVLQHLLLGMNAHINLDLGIATAQTAAGERLIELRRDFLRINELLASLVDDVQDRLGEVWPHLRLLDWVGGRGDEGTMHFSIERARDGAWALATALHACPPEAWEIPIQATDRYVALLGGKVRHPGPLFGSTLRVIRLGERRDVQEVIDLLS